jgi:hypothetical protein
MVTGLAALVAGPVLSQETFRLDTTFRTEIQRKYVNSLLPTADGKLLASGIMRFPGEFSDKSIVRLLSDGSRDGSFVNSGGGGGRIIPWQNKFYVGNGQMIRRIMLATGELDPAFAFGNMPIPYVYPLQGGDYHVFPDGRVLLTGEYLLSDSVRGYEGVYDLVWITNTGYLDTTRVHRQSNGAMWDLAELPSGKFICNCFCSQYDGQPAGEVIRVEADGALDTSFHADFSYALAQCLLPLSDGRVYVGGLMMDGNQPPDTMCLVRLLPGGSLDPAFNRPHFGLSTLPGEALVSCVYPWSEGRLIVGGYFQTANGLPRGGICMIDSTGQVLDAFAGTAVGAYTYQGATYASISSVTQDADGNLLVCGAYKGYNDGMVNDTLQRFVSRLYVVEDTTTGITSASPTNTTSHYTILPNPARGWAAFSYDRKEVAPHDGTITVRDVTGKAVASLPMQGAQGQQVWDTRHVAPGIYLVEFRSGSQLLHTEKLIVQQ